MTPSTFTPTTTSDLGLGSLPNSDINAHRTDYDTEWRSDHASFGDLRGQQGRGLQHDRPARGHLPPRAHAAVRKQRHLWRDRRTRWHDRRVARDQRSDHHRHGSATTIVEAGTSASNGISKVFSFNPLGELNGFAVSLSGLTIQNGKNNDNGSHGDNEGGAFDFDAGPDGNGSLTMNDVVVNQNSTINGDGGGIALFDGGAVSITNSKFSNNTANGGAGGGIYLAYNYAPVTSSTKLTITGSTITGNATAGASGSDGGGILSYSDFPLVIHSLDHLWQQDHHLPDRQRRRDRRRRLRRPHDRPGHGDQRQLRLSMGRRPLFG